MKSLSVIIGHCCCTSTLLNLEISTLLNLEISTLLKQRTGNDKNVRERKKN